MLQNKRVTTSGRFNSLSEYNDVLSKINKLGGEYTSSFKEANVLVIGIEPGSKLEIALKKNMPVYEYTKILEE